MHMPMHIHTGAGTHTHKKKMERQAHLATGPPPPYLLIQGRPWPHVWARVYPHQQQLPGGHGQEGIQAGTPSEAQGVGHILSQGNSGGYSLVGGG